MAFTVSTMAVKLVASAAGFSTGMAKGEEAIKSLQYQATKASSVLEGMAGKLAGVATAAGALVGVKKFADFEQGLAGVGASANLATAEMDRVKDAALNISKATGAKPTAVLEAMDELLKAGLSIDKVLGGAATTVVKFSKVAKLDPGASATAINDSLNVFSKDSLTAAGAADILSKAADASSVSVELVTQAFSQVGAVAAASNQSMRDTAVSIALLGNYGVKGSDAGTSLKTMLVALSAPSTEAAAEIRRLGINVRDASGQMLPMRGIIEELQARLGGLGQAQRDAAIKTVFGTDALRAGNIFLAQGVKGYDDFAKSVESSLGVNDKFARIQNTVNGNFGGTSAAIDRLAIAAGALVDGPLSQLITTGGYLADVSARWIANHDSLAAGTLKWAAATGATVFVISRLVKIGKAIVGTYKAITSAQVVMTALSGPKGWAVLAAGMAIATGAVIGVEKAFESVTESASAASKEARKAADETKAAMAGATAGAAPGSPAIAATPAAIGQDKLDRMLGLGVAARLAARGTREATDAELAYAIATRDAAQAVADKIAALSAAASRAYDPAFALAEAQRSIGLAVAAANKALGEQITFFGLEGAAAERAKLQAMGATAAQLAQFDALAAVLKGMQDRKKEDEAAAETAKSLADSVASVTDRYRDQLAMYGMGTRAAETNALAMKGAGEGALKAARDAAAALDALDKKKGMREAAEKIIESIKTPADILAEKLDEIQRLWLAGLLTAEQVEAANAKAAEEAAGKETATEHGDHFADTKVGVFERRFTAGFQGTDGDAQDKAVALARQQLAEQKATRRAIEKQPVIKGKSI